MKKIRFYILIFFVLNYKKSQRQSSKKVIVRGGKSKGHKNISPTASKNNSKKNVISAVCKNRFTVPVLQKNKAFVKNSRNKNKSFGTKGNKQEISSQKSFRKLENKTEIEKQLRAQGVKKGSLILPGIKNIRERGRGMTKQV